MWSERCTKTVHLEILARRSLLTTIFQTQFIDSLWRRANARNVSFSISVRWSIYIINSVDKPNFRVFFRQLWYTKAVRERRANCPWQALSLSSTHFSSVLLYEIGWRICFKRQSFSSISWGTCIQTLIGLNFTHAHFSSNPNSSLFVCLLRGFFFFFFFSFIFKCSEWKIWESLRFLGAGDSQRDKWPREGPHRKSISLYSPDCFRRARSIWRKERRQSYQISLM